MKAEKENHILEEMLAIYCHGNHGSKKELCPDCRELLEYSRERTDKCPHQPEKPPCSKCTTHCYQPEMRDKIRRVMRYAGPRMPLKHPLLSIDYLKSKLR